MRSADALPKPHGNLLILMAYIVTESCIKCKYTDCVDVCPVDCFREGPNMLVIDPDECIDCTLCVPECPVEAIFAEDDVPDAPAGVHREEPRAVGEVEADHRAQAGARRCGRVDKSEGQKTSARKVKRRSKVPRRNNFVVVMTTEVLKYYLRTKSGQKDILP